MRRLVPVVLLVAAGLMAALLYEEPPIEARLSDPDCTPGMYIAMACDPSRYPRP